MSGTCVQNTEVLGEFLPQVRRGGEVCVCVCVCVCNPDGDFCVCTNLCVAWYEITKFA